MFEDINEPYHEGEQRIQEQTGERDTARSNGRNISRTIPAAARGFIAQQNYVVLGWADSQGALWATFLGGPESFATSDAEGRRLGFNISDPGSVLEQIPPFQEMAEGDHIATLFIELTSRRRLRINGRVTEINRQFLDLRVDVAYPLCPKYIQRRRLEETNQNCSHRPIRKGGHLTGILEQWIVSADTFFVASAHPNGPTDVSHRGGTPGFVSINEGVLTIPDYPGNSMFNTFGNFALNPRAGLLFIDFNNNQQLQLTGRVELDLASKSSIAATGGTGRWWRFFPDLWIVSPLNQAFSWSYIDASPFNP